MDTPTKRCTKCGKDFPATTEYFYRHTEGRYGVHSQCIACVKNHRKEHAEQIRESKARHRKVHATEIREYQRRYGPTYRQAHKAKMGEYNKRHYQEQGDKIREQVRIYREANREQIAQRKKRYAQDHPEAVKASKHRRRARKNNLPNSFTKADWLRCLDYWHGCCAVCGRSSADGYKVAADHWIPVYPNYELTQPNPGTVPTNIIPLCHGKGGCNNSKRGSNPVEWLIKRYGQQEAERILKEITAYFELVHIGNFR